MDTESAGIHLLNYPSIQPFFILDKSAVRGPSSLETVSYCSVCVISKFEQSLELKSKKDKDCALYE